MTAQVYEFRRRRNRRAERHTPRTDCPTWRQLAAFVLETWAYWGARRARRAYAWCMAVTDWTAKWRRG
jgi:hypothetical protein